MVSIRLYRFLLPHFKHEKHYFGLIWCLFSLIVAWPSFFFSHFPFCLSYMFQGNQFKKRKEGKAQTCKHSSSVSAGRKIQTLDPWNKRVWLSIPPHSTVKNWALTPACASTLPFVSFDVVPLDVLQVVSHVVLQRGHHAAVFVHQLGGARLRREPVHHGRQLLLLHLLVSPQQTAVTRRCAHSSERGLETHNCAALEMRLDQWVQVEILNSSSQSSFTWLYDWRLS